MGRIIKFRAKAMSEEAWVYGDLIHYTRPRYEKATIREASGLEHDIVEETVCEFTGEYDSKGVEIYENDILDMSITSPHHKQPDHRTRKVIFKDMGFSIVNWHNDCVCDCVSSCEKVEYTVIGNLIDNPELMKH